MGRVLAISNHEGLCWKCLQDKLQIHNIVIPEMGYCSQFDGKSTEIHLCDECYQESIKDNSELWSMEEILSVIYGDYGCTEYKYEREMLEYIKNMPLQGRQFVDNEFSTSADLDMEAQDWIDYELNVLPHDKLHEYGLYSPEEIKVFDEILQSLCGGVK